MVKKVDLRYGLSVLILLMVVGVWIVLWQGDTAVSSITIPRPQSAHEQAIQQAIQFSHEVTKPVGGSVVGEPLRATIQREPYNMALDRLGTYAIATYEGSNIFFAEFKSDEVLFVHLYVQWQPFSWPTPNEEPETTRYYAALVNPEINEVVAAGSSTVLMLTGNP